MSFQLPQVDDPENVAPLVDATCAIIESHVSYLEPQITVIVGVWRSAEAYSARKRHATTLRVNLGPTKSSEFLRQRETEPVTVLQEIAAMEEICREFILKEI